MTRPLDAGRRDDEEWLGWEPEVPEGGADDAQAAEPDGAWLRHDVGAVQDAAAPAPERGTGAAWLSPEVALPDTRPPAPTAPIAPTASTAPIPPIPQAGVPAPPAGDPAGHAAHPAYRADDLTGEDGDLPTTPRPTGPGNDPPASGLAVVGAAVKEFAIVVGMALVLSFVVKTWLMQAFYIPSGSMEDTLQVDDRVIVSKLTPGPIDLKRGDIVVFGDPGEWVEPPVEQQHGEVATLVRDAMTFVGLLPDDAENHLIKRVIGLPGDKVVCCDAGGRITVNGRPVKEPYLKPGVAPSEQKFSITVPRGKVWVMGDNRSGSADSRAHDGPKNDGRLGSVDERLIVGRAVALVWPLDHLTWLSNPSETFKDVPAPPAEPTDQPQPQGAARTDDPTTGGDGTGG